ncbi:PREDICTED: G-type lectin S-receptor-like serine/threonine-protein kinase At1g11280 [Brassica oleracea var. oleracea]|uniref:G-type lectin S-receptor-like serine/threonine-protein kinase At1g11280 n=1 Tax=Brassica oleracea var. oleracea TaxID=109376 RepID=UPI0006A6FBA7|nr:PREDICTED: G-type lectin S-receptor-like serine/threonine-protein kinase At1g11280 [Brassica oleracea var. oleracea]
MREMGIVLFPSLLLLSTSLTKGYAAITRASPLSLGQTLSSPGGTYELGFFSPNNSQNQYLGIWFKKLTPRVIVWVANREKPVTNLVANLTISINGSLILLDSSQNVVWSTRTPSTSNKCHAKLLDTRVPNVLWQDLCELPCFSFMTLKLQKHGKDPGDDGTVDNAQHWTAGGHSKIIWLIVSFSAPQR